MKLAVTGALGHIGSAFIRSLAGRQYDEVLLLDNLMGERYSALFDLPPDVPFRFVEADIRTADLESMFARVRYGHSPRRDHQRGRELRHRRLVHDVNFNGTVRVAEACRNTGARMLFLSTTSVYGTQLEVSDENCPANELESAEPVRVEQAERGRHLIEMGAKGLEFVTVRFGTVFGKSIGMRFHTAINKFCWQASVGQPILRVAHGAPSAAPLPPRRRRRAGDASSAQAGRVRQRAL